jgi:hypothetical protein
MYSSCNPVRRNTAACFILPSFFIPCTVAYLINGFFFQEILLPYVNVKNMWAVFNIRKLFRIFMINFTCVLKWLKSCVLCCSKYKPWTKVEYRCRWSKCIFHWRCLSNNNLQISRILAFLLYGLCTFSIFQWGEARMINETFVVLV